MKFHKATNLGIEIEICVEKEKYKSLKTERKNGEKVYKYPKGEDPFRPGYVSNSENSNESNNSNSDKSEELRDQYFEMSASMTEDDIRSNMKNENASFQMNWNNEKNDMVMYCWWKANSPDAIIETLGEMANMFENDIKEMPNIMNVSD